MQDIHFYDLQALFSKQLGNMSANVQGLARGMFLPLALVRITVNNVVKSRSPLTSRSFAVLWTGGTQEEVSSLSFIQAACVAR